MSFFLQLVVNPTFLAYTVLHNVDKRLTNKSTININRSETSSLARGWYHLPVIGHLSGSDVMYRHRLTTNDVLNLRGWGDRDL